MKIEISLSDDYCPTWGSWEGVRELVQNWMDERDTGKPAAMEYSDNTLTLWNEGARLERRQMALFGETNKTGDERGKFGEGFKIGAMALVRAGHSFIVETPHGRYQATIEASIQYEANVLVFTRLTEAPIDGVRVKIGCLDESLWSVFERRFLWDSPRNSILKDRAGEVFVKDIWVGEFAFRLGYNLSNVKTDRDRKLVDPWDLKWETGRVVNESLKLGVVTPGEVLGMLVDKTADVEALRSHVTATTRPMLVAAFKEKHGDAAVAVDTMMDAKAAEHRSLTPIVSTGDICLILADSKAKAYAMNSVRKTYILSDVSDDEMARLAWAISILEDSGTKIGAAIDIVEFTSKDTLGQRKDGNIYIARKALANKTKTLQTLVEEVAHAKGHDGSMEHKWELHAIYIRLVMLRMDDGGPGVDPDYEVSTP